MKQLTILLAILFSCFLNSSVALSEEDKSNKIIVFGVASNEAIQTLIYTDMPVSLKTTFNEVEQVPGFEGCTIEQYVMGAAGSFLVCDGKEFTLRLSEVVGDCEYLGIHRSDGLGSRKKATWEAWIIAAKVCNENPEKIKVFEERKTSSSWAGKDPDQRF